MSHGRIIQENKTNYILADGTKEYSAVVRGKFHTADGFPKVGDYVEYVMTGKDEVVIENILPRKTQIVRKAAGTGNDQQVIVANVDTILIVMGLDEDFNLNRLDRYILLAEQSSIEPIIVLNKSDVVPNPEEFLEQVTSRHPHLEVRLVSAGTGTNTNALHTYLDTNVTAVLLGSSGAGKSTITNWLLNHATQDTQEVRADDGRGRHTTTARHLFTLPNGAYLIDTPGMRELALVGEVDGSVSEQVDELRQQCKFRDCDHEKSLGCAVQAAIAEGLLTSEQLTSLLKLKREKHFLESRGDKVEEFKYKQEDRKLHRKYNQIKQAKFGKR